MIMTQEELDLLIRDLCDKLPYGVKTTYSGIDAEIRGIDVPSKTVDLIEWGKHRFAAVPIHKIKPRLRPMNSATAEERYAVRQILGDYIDIWNGYIDILDSSNRFSFEELQAVFDWLNTHHFDYRGLIAKGLAVEDTENGK